MLSPRLRCGVQNQARRADRLEPITNYSPPVCALRLGEHRYGGIHSCAPARRREKYIVCKWRLKNNRNRKSHVVVIEARHFRRRDETATSQMSCSYVSVIRSSRAPATVSASRGRGQTVRHFRESAAASSPAVSWRACVNGGGNHREIAYPVLMARIGWPHRVDSSQGLHIDCQSSAARRAKMEVSGMKSCDGN